MRRRRIIIIREGDERQEKILERARHAWTTIQSQENEETHSSSTRDLTPFANHFFSFSLSATHLKGNNNMYTFSLSATHLKLESNNNMYSPILFLWVVSFNGFAELGRSAADDDENALNYKDAVVLVAPHEHFKSACIE